MSRRRTDNENRSTSGARLDVPPGQILRTSPSERDRNRVDACVMEMPRFVKKNTLVSWLAQAGVVIMVRTDRYVYYLS
jgi:hypothetical protein